jgi:pimeloyl-ACP methyl ester carboxylesterase
MHNSADYVFMHGGGQGGWVWDDAIEALKCQTGGTPGRTLALDAPGCGAKRNRQTENLKITDIARELVADIKEAGLKDVILIGHSQAGQVLPLMAAIRPGLFKRLVYVSCIAQPSGQTIPAMFGNGVRGSNKDEIGWPADPETTSSEERFKLMFCNDMAPVAATAFLAKLGFDAWPPQAYTESEWRYDHLGAIPSTYVICLQDLALPASWQESFAQRFRVSREVRIDAGHQVMNTRPHALAEILRDEAQLS